MTVSKMAVLLINWNKIIITLSNINYYCIIKTLSKLLMVHIVFIDMHLLISQLRYNALYVLSTLSNYIRVSL